MSLEHFMNSEVQFTQLGDWDEGQGESDSWFDPQEEQRVSAVHLAVE